MKESASDIVQIIPADGWFAIFDNDGKEFKSPLVAWGLQRDSTIIPLDLDRKGQVDDPTNNSKFKEIYHKFYWKQHHPGKELKQTELFTITKKTTRKVDSKYTRKYGYSIAEMARITGWAHGTIYNYLQTTKLRKELFAEIDRMLKQKRKKKKS